MVKNLKEELEGFSQNIKEGFPDYAAIYSYFVEYINEVLHKNEEFTLSEFLTSEFSQRTMLKSCAYYCENSNAKTVTAIEKFLNAMTKLYSGYMLPNGYDNSNLSNIQPFSKLKNEASKFIKNKKLRSKQSIQPITDYDFDVIINYLQSIEQPTIIQKQISIIFKLLMLYGFKFERLIKLEKKSFNNIKRTLQFVNEYDSEISLELPALLALEIHKYLNDAECNTSNYMFMTNGNKLIKAGFLTNHFNTIKKLHKNKITANSYTSTGLAKYAIIKMLEAKMNVPVIKIITGMDDDIVNDCARIYYKIDETDTINRYINSTIRTIKSYDAIANSSLKKQL